MALAALAAITQLGVGIYQAVESANQSDKPRPQYRTPDEILRATNIARQQAYGQMPGYELAKQNIEQQNASAMTGAQNVAQSGSDVLGFLAARQPGTNKAYEGLAVKNAEFQNMGLERYKQALGIQAGYRDKEFQYNQQDPYEEAMKAAAIGKEGAIQNIYGAVSGYAGNMLAKNESQKYWDYLNGGNKSAAGGSDLMGLFQQYQDRQAQQQGALYPTSRPQNEKFNYYNMLQDIEKSYKAPNMESQISSPYQFGYDVSTGNFLYPQTQSNPGGQGTSPWGPTWISANDQYDYVTKY